MASEEDADGDWDGGEGRRRGNGYRRDRHRRPWGMCDADDESVEGGAATTGHDRHR